MSSTQGVMRLVSIDDYDSALRAEVALIQTMLTGADDDALARLSPCPGWSVLDVGRHVEVTPRALASGLAAHAHGETASPSGALPATAGRDEVTSSLQVTSVQLTDALKQLRPQDLDGQLPGPLGPMTGRRMLDLALTEITLHRCDIALGLDRSVEIERAVARTLLDVVHAWLLLIAPEGPKPDQPLCYRLSGGPQHEWCFRFDGERWSGEVCSDDERTVTAEGQVSALALGLAGRIPFEQAVISTSDVGTLAMMKTYLPGP